MHDSIYPASGSGRSTVRVQSHQSLPPGAHATRYLRCLFPLHINKNQASLHEQDGDYEPDDRCQYHGFKLAVQSIYLGKYTAISA